MQSAERAGMAPSVQEDGARCCGCVLIGLIGSYARDPSVVTRVTRGRERQSNADDELHVFSWRWIVRLQDPARRAEMMSATLGQRCVCVCFMSVHVFKRDSDAGFVGGAAPSMGHQERVVVTGRSDCASASRCLSAAAEPSADAARGQSRPHQGDSGWHCSRATCQRPRCSRHSAER